MQDRLLGGRGGARQLQRSTRAAPAGPRRSTGAGSAWTRTAGPTASPGGRRRRAGRRRPRRRSGSLDLAGPGSRSSVAAKDSSVPALINQVSSVPNAAAIQDATDSGPERVELDSGHEGQRQLHHDRLPEERRQRDRDPADRGGQLDEQRSHDQADHPGRGGGHEQRRPRRVAVKPGSSQAVSEQRQRRRGAQDTSSRTTSAPCTLRRPVTGQVPERGSLGQDLGLGRLVLLRRQRAGVAQRRRALAAPTRRCCRPCRPRPARRRASRRPSPGRP